jgi:hypothetical protein
MRHLFVATLALTTLLTQCIGWDEYYASKSTHGHSSETTQSDTEMIAVKAGREGTYYLIDQTRGLCFFQAGDALTAVDCEAIPEARELLGIKGSTEKNIRTPNPIASPKRNTSSVSTEPTTEEIDAFKAAYSAIVCHSRRGTEFTPQDEIAKQELSVKRYTQIEGYLAQQKKAWAKLTREASRSCIPSAKPAPDVKPTEAVDTPLTVDSE